MTIEEILNLLPDELLSDETFQDIEKTIFEDFESGKAKVIVPINVSEDLLEFIAKKDDFKIADNGNILHFIYVIGEDVCSLGAKYIDESLFVYYEKSSFAKMDRKILIKTDSINVVQSKTTLKENGFYVDYQSDVHYYDIDYNELDIDGTQVLDEMFSDEFGIPLKSASIMRHKFPLYANYLSYFSSEQKMRLRDSKLKDIDFLYFRSPWLVSEIRGFIEEEYNNVSNVAIRTHINKMVENCFVDVNRIAKITDWIQSNLNEDSEMVISDNIFGNLFPILVGEDVSGFDTRGIIIEKRKEDYFLYQVHFTTDKTCFVKDLITKEQAQELFKANNKNLEVEGLSEFFGITRGR